MTLDELVKWSQVIGVAALVATLIVYWHQLRTMQGQLGAARDASQSQNVLTLIDYIQRADHRDARRTLFKLENKLFDDWSIEDQKFAEMACSGWDTVGLVLRNTTIPGALEVIVGNWRHSIHRCHILTGQLRDRLRDERDPDFWDDFDWLAAKALDGYKIVGTSLRPA